MLIRLFEVRQTESKGKGLFARDFVPKGTAVFFECQRCRRISKGGFEALPEEEKAFVQRYGYRKADGSHLLPCDEIIYLNHSCNANILDSGRGFDIVVRDIEKGEEATYDYRLFHDSDELEFQCLCGEDVCCGTVRCAHPQPGELTSFWNEKTGSALKSLNKVYQPLGWRLLF